MKPKHTYILVRHYRKVPRATKYTITILLINNFGLYFTNLVILTFTKNSVDQNHNTRSFHENFGCYIIEIMSSKDMTAIHPNILVYIVYFYVYGNQQT